MAVKIDSFEQILFDGMEPLDKETIKSISEKVADLLQSYYRLKNTRLKTYEIERQQLIAMSEDTSEIDRKITLTNLFIERVEHSLESCSPIQKEILLERFIIWDHKRRSDEKARMNLNDRTKSNYSPKTFDRDKKEAILDFAYSYGIII